MDSGKSGQLTTKRIRLWGIVQGVGFRPFVAKLAGRMAMAGQVRNLGGLVEIIVTDAPDRIDAFLIALRNEKPAPAEIAHMQVDEPAYRQFDGFTILDSGDGAEEAAMIPADLSICPDCLREMRDPTDPRHRHPFISCMACGPRYTIIDRIPYDRINTAMAEYPMCPSCEAAYGDREDRRHHAQTISCHDCGPVCIYADGRDLKRPAATMSKEPRHWLAQNEAALSKAAALLRGGGILAFKATGGYNYAASPFLDGAVRDLRRLKAREDKPFAVLFGDTAQIRQYCHVSSEEEELLVSAARPIVLLERRADAPAMSAEVFRTSRFLGAFLPSIGLQHLLIDGCGPLIMTSANIADEPIIIGDEAMREALAGRLDRLAAVGEPVPETGILYHERAIRIRLDDSVVRVIDRQPQMIRRSKGYAPVPLCLPGAGLTEADMALACGGQLKASFCLTKGPFAYVSQYFGDLDSPEAVEIYGDNVGRMERLFRIRPSVVACDLHPAYRTTAFAEAYARKAEKEGRPVRLLRVQHHHAHAASVIAEHDLSGKVLGVCFDGTGYGTDGAIWGGEFLLCEDDDYVRTAHLDYVRMLGGDTSMREGWKTALCYLHAAGLDGMAPDDPRGVLVRAALDSGVNAIRSSSMGRLFDAVAAISGIHDTNRYEGECAIMLENAAADAMIKRLEPAPMAFSILEDGRIEAGPVIEAVAEYKASGIDRERIALGFHDAVAAMILSACRRERDRHGVEQAALTGGVFQNRILTEKTLAHLRQAGFRAYYNISVGPNDGGVCLGQASLAMRRLASERP